MSQAVIDEERRVYAGYLALQAVAGVVFWALLTWSPAARELFELMADRDEVTDAFVTADLGVIVASALAAWAVWRRATWAVPATSFTAGGMVYPTLYLVAWVAMAGTGGATLAIMVPPSALSCWVAYRVWVVDRRD